MAKSIGIKPLGSRVLIKKLEAEVGDYREQDEDVLTYALFGQVALDFFKRRAAIRSKIDPDALDAKNKAYPV